MNKPAQRRDKKSAQWTADDIRKARDTMLAPILASRGYPVMELPNGAVLLQNFRGLIIHGNRWIWKSQQMYGNSLDFFITIDGKTFSEAMEILRNPPSHDCTAPNQSLFA